MLEEGSIFNALLVERLNYFIYVVLLLIGLWAMIAKNNLIKKLIGMSFTDGDYLILCIDRSEGRSHDSVYLPEHDPHGILLWQTRTNRTHLG